jgi:hypothetical protein
LQGQRVNLRANVNGYLDAVSLRYELFSLGRENHEMQGGLVNQSRSAIELGVSPRVVLSGPDDWCQEQFELAHALADAVTKVNIAMQNVENARKGNTERKPHALVLRNARTEARKAVTALDKGRCRQRRSGKMELAQRPASNPLNQLSAHYRPADRLPVYNRIGLHSCARWL